MIDRLRIALNRPLSDHERRRLFAIAAVVIVGVAGLLALIDHPGPPTHEARRTHTTTPAPASAVPPPAPAADAVSLEAPSEEGQPRRDLRGSHVEVASAKRAARRFLAGYLPYSYGRRGARRIPGATLELRRRLAAIRPRVPVRERRRRARVVLVQANGVGQVRADLVALVDDGARRYTVPLELARERAGWRVTAVGS